MEKLVNQRYKKQYLGKGKVYYPKVNLIRYADDFVVTAENKEILEEIKILLTDFLAQRGLTLSEEKTLITHISNGFDFLGFNVRKYNGTLLIKPSEKSQKKMTEKLHEVVFKHKSASQCLLIEMLNPVINKYFHAEGSRQWVFKDTFEYGEIKKTFVLKKLSDIPITRYLKIRKDANPFDPAWDAYLEKRRDKRLRVQHAKRNFIGQRLAKVIEPV